MCSSDLHKTPFGTVTNDFLEKLPDPKTPWPAPEAETTTAKADADAADAAKAAAKKKPSAKGNVPMSPYVAQLKARYDAYNSASGVSKSAGDAAEHDRKRAPGSAFSHSSRRVEKAAKRALTADELAKENDAYATHFLKPTLHALAAGLLAVRKPAAVVRAGDQITDTPMEVYLADRKSVV